ncbi:MAG: sugar kinase [Acidimicrobiales bacterium]
MRRGNNEARPVVVVGDLMTDVVVLLQEQFAPESDTASEITIGPGGSGSNVAVFLVRGGVAAALVGAVGDDDRGQALVDALVREKVSPYVQVARGSHTGTVVSVVNPGGRRSMLTDRGANLSLDTGSLPDELFGAGGHLHLSGYAVIDEATRATAIEIFDRAGASQMSRSVDCSSAAPLARMGAQAFFETTKGADVLFANGEEAQAITGSTDPAVLASHYPMSIVTLGARGVALIERGASPRLFAPRDAPIVDTTGAGDAFTGAFLAAWVRDAEPDAAIETGLEAAASVVQIPGARPSR